MYLVQGSLPSAGGMPVVEPHYVGVSSGESGAEQDSDDQAGSASEHEEYSRYLRG